jgi:hypothetical protein
MKHVLTLALICCLLPALQAQQRDLRFGLQASPAFTWMTTDNNLINSDGTNLGLKLGLTSEYYFRENYAISSGIGFHFNAGGKLFYEDRFERISLWPEVDGVPDTLTGGTAFKYSVQYVEIPIGLKLRTREFGYLRYFLQPELGLWFQGRSRGNVENTSEVDPEEDLDIGSAVANLNLSWGIGGGIEYSLSDNTALIGGLAFQSGFADVTRDRNTTLEREGRQPERDDSKGRINSLVIRIGVMF